MEKNFYRIMAGKRSIHAEERFEGGLIGADFGISHDLSKTLYDDWKKFNQHYIPIFLENHPDKTKVGAGLACGALWTVAKGIKKGEFVLCPNGNGGYLVGEVTGDYVYQPGKILPGEMHPATRICCTTMSLMDM